MLYRVEGLALYLLVCGCAVLAGLGAVRGMRLNLSARAALVFSPVAALLLWSLFIGLGVGLGWPVRRLAPWFWGGSLLLAAYGLKPARASIRDGGGLLLVCLAAPIVLMARHFAFGLTEYTGGIPPDGWSYVTYSAYIWEYPRGTEGGLSPAFQYAAHLNVARYISRGLISVFSPLSHVRDTQSVAALYQAFTLFVVACATAFYLTATNRRTWVAAASSFFAVVGGWMANLVWAFNFDNGIALFYMPAIAGLLTLYRPREIAWWLMSGMFLAGILYTYPELAPLVILSALVIALPRLVRERSDWRWWFLAAAASVIVAALLILPEADTLANFWRSQFNLVQKATSLRTAEGYFTGIKSAELFPGALWGLGHEHRLTNHVLSRNLLGLILSGLAFLGVLRLAYIRQWGHALVILLLLAAAVYWTAARDYSYAAYKMININWWGMAVAVVTGAELILDRSRRRRIRVAVAAVLIVLGIAWASQAYHGTNRALMAQYLRSPSEFLNAPDFRRVRDVIPIVQTESLLNLAEDWLAYNWAVFYLRDVPMHLPVYRVLMDQPNVIPYLQRARQVDRSSCRYALTDRTFDAQGAALMNWIPVWQDGAYRLWELPGPAWVIRTRFTDSYGQEMVLGRPFFWLGERRATLELFAGASGRAVLGVSFRRGPDLSPHESCRLRIQSDSGIDEEVEILDAYHSISIPVDEGANEVSLTVLNTPREREPGARDSRVLLLGMWDPAIALQPPGGTRLAHATLTIAENRNGVEEREGIPFIWLGDGETAFAIDSTATGMAYLSANMILGPSLPESSTRAVRLTATGGYNQEHTLHAGIQALPFPVRAGSNRLTLRVLDRPSVEVAAGGDRRPLLLGMERPRLWIGADAPPR